MLAIYKKELCSFFVGMMGYVFIAFILLILGIYTMVYNIINLYPNLEYALASSTFMFLIAIPILTMRVLAEEKKQKTDQLLYSAPVRLSAVVWGKYFALVTVYVIPLLIVSIYPLILSAYGTVWFPSAYTTMFGFLMLGAALISVGVFVSSLTENQIIAAIVSFAAMLLLYWVDDLGMLINSSATASLIAFAVFAAIIALIVRLMTKSTSIAVTVGLAAAVVLVLLYIVMPSALGKALNALFSSISVFARFKSFTSGMFDLSAAVYDLSVIILMLFFSTQALEKKRFA